MSSVNALVNSVHALSIHSASTPPGYPAYTGNPDLITPGVVGFFAIFFIAVATVLLLVDMNRRIRRTRYRAEVQEQLRLEAEAASAAAAKAARKGQAEKPAS